MKLEFVGGAEEVGSLGVMASSAESRVLFDYGMTPAKPPRYPRKIPRVDHLFLTHSHLDHVGTAPWLSGEYGTTVWGSEVTLEVAMVLLQDSIKISQLEGYSIPFDITDVRRFSEEGTIIRHGERAFLDPFTIRSYDAGHIPGSSMYMFNDGGKDFLFTGDINMTDTRLLNGAKTPKCDVLIMESTYAGREHPERKEVEKEFIAKVEEVLDRGGKAIVPSFAVGRTQEVAQVLSKVDEEKWLDGMGRRVAKIYQRHPESIKSLPNLRRALDGMNFVRTPHQRDKAADASIVVTTSGMLDGGPVHEYIKRNRNDPNSAILLTGYQVEDTNGRMLMDTGSMELNGEVQKIQCEVCHFDFSAHADHEELLMFAKASGAEEVILVHGDNREELASDIQSFSNVRLPKDGDVMDI